MKKNNYRFLVWLGVLAVGVFAGAVVLKGRQAIAPGDVSGDVGAGSVGAEGGAQNPTPDDVSTAPLPDSDVVVSDATAGYYFSMPSNWYLEKNAGAGVTVYPDYDPKSGDAPECKIELSVLAGATGDLDTWLTRYLHADPTADVAETSRMPITIGGSGGGGGASGGSAASATSSAIEWHGDLNGVTTTLVYAAMPAEANAASGGGAASAANENNNILEIAPSTLSEASDADNDDCDFDLQALVANLEFGNYEP